MQFRDDDKFETGAAQFLQDVPSEKARDLINMLRGDRKSWSSILIGTRDQIVHDVDSPQLRMTYGVAGGKLRAAFPTVNRQELRQYLNLCWENLFQAVEETVLLCVAIRLPDRIVPCRIPDDKVDPQLRFRWSFAIRPDRPDKS